MCGRFTLRATLADVAEYFQLDGLPTWDWSARYNIAPTQTILAIRLDQSATRRAVPLRWGLVPSWAKDPTIGQRMINARAETVATKPSFRTAFRRRRCLVPADGYYEWQSSAGVKLPMLLERPNRALFSFAGLWESWQSPAGESIESVTLITTSASPQTAHVHHRMPAILSPQDYTRWLGEQPATDLQLQQLLQPYAIEPLVLTPVATYVNRPGNEGPDCVKPRPHDNTTKTDTSPPLLDLR